MSILDQGPINVMPVNIKVANQLINMTVRSYQSMVDSFNRGAILFWHNPQGLSPAEIAEALGTNAKEVFQLHYKLGELIGSVKLEAISESLSIIGEFTYNEDGSINIIEPEPAVVEETPANPETNE